MMTGMLTAASAKRMGIIKNIQARPSFPANSRRQVPHQRLVERPTRVQQHVADVELVCGVADGLLVVGEVLQVNASHVSRVEPQAVSVALEVFEQAPLAEREVQLVV